MLATPTFLVNPNYVSLMGWKKIIDDSPHFRMIGSADSIIEWPEAISSHTLLLADLSSNGESVLDQVSRLIRQKHIDLLVVVDVKHESLIKKLKEIDIRGILTTHCDAQEIKTALENIRLGKRFYCGDILEVLMQPKSTTKKEISEEPLSTRELEVLEWVVKGMTTNQIADQLSVSTHTINSHRKNMLKKLGLTSPVELIVYAVRQGLVDLN